MLKIVEKLPFALRTKWRDLADDITSCKLREITFDDVVGFVEKRARALNHPTFGKLNSNLNRNKLNKPQDPKQRFNFGVDYKPKEIKVRCMICEGDHILPRCNRFKSEPLEERLRFVRRKGLCYNCLFQGHVVNSCPKHSFYKVPGCQSKHSTFLHPRIHTSDRRNFEDGPPVHTKEEENGIKNSGADNAQERCVNATKIGSGVTGAGVITTGLPIVPVKVKCAGSSRVVTTYALLDAGSNTTFCTQELLKELGVKGKKTTVLLTTLQNEDNQIDCDTIALNVFDLEEDQMVAIPTVFSTSRLPVSKSSLPLQTDIDKWDHLKGINLPNLKAEVGLVRQFHSFRSKLESTIPKVCDMEFNDALVDDKSEMSIEDSRALEIIESSVRIQLKNGHYEIALPWKTSPPCLSNNRSVAEHRFEPLKRRFIRDPALYSKYSDFMDDLLNKGYARQVPATSIDHPQHPLWYLPHHPVMNSNKPDKVRVVFDCASVFQGLSLNAQLLQGPDLANNLVGVLFRFREEPVAMMSDVESMFHQVNVNP